jgi:hypothetical protein
MLTPHQFDKWVEALRSGKYRQAHFQLHNSMHDTYCCLGVCRKVNRIGNIGIYLSLKKIDQDCQDALMELNDFKRQSFKEIARYLVKNKRKFVCSPKNNSKNG